MPIPLERVHLALRAHLQVVHTQLDVATVWLKEWHFLQGKARKRFLSERRRDERRIENLFMDANEAGDLPANLDRRHALLLFFSVGNWAYTWMSDKTDVAAEADAFWGLLLRGLLAEPRP